MHDKKLFTFTDAVGLYGGGEALNNGMILLFVDVFFSWANGSGCTLKALKVADTRRQSFY